MFAFFIDNVFFDFWGNKPEDIFVDNTVAKMQWSISEVSLYYYPNIPARRPAIHSFDESKNLLIQEKVITIENEVEVEEIITTSTINAVAYVVNGEKILPC